MSSGIQAFNEGYVKTVWQTGDVITAEKLNNIEGGIENAYPFYIQYAEEFTLDKTYGDILEAVQNGMLPFVISPGENGFTIEPIVIGVIDPNDDKYTVKTANNVAFKADTDTDPLVEAD